jgi:hypothetical protein
MLSAASPQELDELKADQPLPFLRELHQLIILSITFSPFPYALLCHVMSYVRQNA